MKNIILLTIAALAAISMTSCNSPQASADLAATSALKAESAAGKAEAALVAANAEIENLKRFVSGAETIQIGRINQATSVAWMVTSSAILLAVVIIGASTWAPLGLLRKKFRKSVILVEEAAPAAAPAPAEVPAEATAPEKAAA